MDMANSSSEDRLSRIVYNYFLKMGYTSRMNVAIFHKGFQFIADLFFEKTNEKGRIEKIIVEVKRTAPTFETLDQMGVYSKFLNDAKWYLCLPAEVEISVILKAFLKKSSLGLMIVRGGEVEVVVPVESYVESRKKLNESFKSVQRERSNVFGFKFRKLGQEPTTSEEMHLTNIMKMERELDSLKDSLNRLNQIDMVLNNTVPFKLRISSELLDSLPKLKNIAYSSELIAFERKYRKAKSFDDEYQICLDTLTKLWSKYRKEKGATALKAFKEFEPLLLDIPGYRDHMIHPFQVFLMGSIIIDNYYPEFTQAYNSKLQPAPSGSLDFAWLLCATFHDFCYPIQMYESVSKRFFSEFLQIKNAPSLSQFETDKILLRKGQMKLIDQLVSLYCHYNIGQNNNWVFDSQCKINEEIRFILLQKVSEKKNHAALSALTLLNTVLGEKVAKLDDNYLEGAFSSAVYPAALAIALHDNAILRDLPRNNYIIFDSMPLTLLLIYCDNAQEFGRAKSHEYCTLKSLNFGKNLVEAQLLFSKKTVYNNKMKESSFVFGKLKSNTISFKLKHVFDEEEHTNGTSKPQ